jgi:hypothetical protein
MIKVTTSSGTVYIIDQDNSLIKRIPAPGTELSSVLRGFINLSQWQPFRDISEIEVGKSLSVTYYNEQNWSMSTPIKEIYYNFEEENISEE